LMRVVRSPAALGRVKKPIVLAAGAFDGIHRGHQKVVREAMRVARRLHGEAWVLTFEPHPLRVLRPDLAPALITSRAHKLDLLQALGLAGCIELAFTKQLSLVEAAPFIARLKKNVAALKHIVVGENWRFGRGARGTPALLREYARTHNLTVTVVRPLKWRGRKISSTRVRQAVATGKMEEARRLLGRPFSIRGRVIHGKKLGRKLGFPTANVDPQNEIRPPAGIYAARAQVGGRIYPSAVYIGPGARIVEAHLIGQDLDLYGRDMEVFFERRIRADRTFSSLDQTRRQIARDVVAARRALRRP